MGQFRCLVSFHRLIQRHFRMVLAGFVIALVTVLRRRAMAFGGVLVFLRSGSVRVNCVVVFVHGKAPYLCDHYSIYAITTASLYENHRQNNVKNESSHNQRPRLTEGITSSNRLA